MGYKIVNKINENGSDFIMNENILVEMISVLNEAVFVFDTNGIIKSANEVACKLFKVENSNQFKNITDIFDKNQQLTILSEINNNSFAKKVNYDKFHFSRSDQSVFKGKFNINLLTALNGAGRLYIASVNVNEADTKDQNLIKTKSILQATIDSTNFAINVITKDRELITFNKKFVEMWNLPPNFDTIFSTDERLDFMKNQVRDKEVFHKLSQHLLNDLNRESYDIIYFKDGRIIGRNALPFRVEDEVKGKLLAYEDITEKINADQKLHAYSNELKELNATKDKFFSIIAHDLKNPFNGILGFSNLLEDDYDQLDDEERKLFIRQIKNSALTAYKLLENLLEWSRAQTGSLQWKPDYCDLSNVVNESIMLLKDQALAKEIKLVSLIPYNTIVYADMNMLKTVIRNFIQNSIKFTNRNGEIKVLCKNDSKYVTTTVKDNGVGINDEIRKKLFKIDQKIVSEGTEKEKGTGLGLFLCKEFIELNGGKISVNSTEGKGSEFSFTIPVNK